MARNGRKNITGFAMSLTIIAISTVATPAMGEKCFLLTGKTAAGKPCGIKTNKTSVGLQIGTRLQLTNQGLSFGPSANLLFETNRRLSFFLTVAYQSGMGESMGGIGGAIDIGLSVRTIAGLHVVGLVSGHVNGCQEKFLAGGFNLQGGLEYRHKFDFVVPFRLFARVTGGGGYINRLLLKSDTQQFELYDDQVDANMAFTVGLLGF